MPGQSIKRDDKILITIFSLVLLLSLSHYYFGYVNNQRQLQASSELLHRSQEKYRLSNQLALIINKRTHLLAKILLSDDEFLRQELLEQYHQLYEQGYQTVLKLKESLDTQTEKAFFERFKKSMDDTEQQRKKITEYILSDDIASQVYELHIKLSALLYPVAEELYKLQQVLHLSALNKQKHLTSQNRSRQHFFLIQIGFTLFLFIAGIAFYIFRLFKQRYHFECENQKALERIQFLSSLPEINNLPVMSIRMHKKHAEIIYANPAAEEILAFWNCTHHRQLPNDIFQQLLQYRDHNREYYYEIKIGQRILDLRFQKTSKQTYNVYARDVTAEHRHIEVLEQKQQELNHMIEVANAASRAKSEFLSQMSHELRTPLNAIIGFSQLILFSQNNLNDLQKENIEQIHQSGQHLLNLINDILDLSRIESGKYQIETTNFEFGQLLQEQLSLIRPLADKKGIQIEVWDQQQVLQLPQLADSCNYQVRADRHRLGQVLVNLLSNAVKYNKTNGKIQIVMEPVYEKHILRVHIKDSGLGLSQEQQQLLFRPFERLGQENSTIEGSGIGLVIAKQMIECMHGSIGVSSEQGQGSDFWITIPLSQAQQSEHNP